MGLFCVMVLFNNSNNKSFLLCLSLGWVVCFFLFLINLKEQQNDDKSFLQIRFQPNDHKTIKETADELKIFEGIKHPNLVRYFGVELHRVRKHKLLELFYKAKRKF